MILHQAKRFKYKQRENKMHGFQQDWKAHET